MGQDLGGRAKQDFIKRLCVQRHFRTDIGGVDAAMPCEIYEARSGVNRTRGSHNEQLRGLLELAGNLFHGQRHLTEPDNMGTNGASAIVAAGQVFAVRRVVSKRHVAALATRLKEHAVHVVDSFGAGAFMEIVDVLGA